MSVHATVSATFPTLSSAEAAIASLLKDGFPGDDVILTKGSPESTYLVSVRANERYREVEDELRQQEPLHWRSSIRDSLERDTGDDKTFLHFVSDADQAEQDAPWIAQAEPSNQQDQLAGSEADWSEQFAPAFPTGPGADDEDQAVAASGVPEADHAEQIKGAYFTPVEEEE
jgi:hypothetical protein